MRVKKSLIFLIGIVFLLSSCSQPANSDLNNLNTSPPASSASAQTTPHTTGTASQNTPDVSGATAAPKSSAAPTVKPGEPTKKPDARQTPKPIVKTTMKPKSTLKPTPKPTPKPTLKPTQYQVKLYINEFMGSNGTIPDADVNNEDWIELYNPGSQDVNLTGYYLSDDSANLVKWKFPNVTIPKKEFLLVWASKKDKIDSKGEAHTNFKIDKTLGEDLILTNPDGVTIMDKYTPTISITRDKSIGRTPSGGSTWTTFDTPTPRKPN